MITIFKNNNFTNKGRSTSPPIRNSILAVTLLGLSLSVSGQNLPEPPSGPAPGVDAVEKLPLINPSFTPGGEQEPVAVHPPLGDIPPMPMPYPPDANSLSPVNQGPGAPVIRDLTTGEVTTGAEASTAMQNIFSQGGYYAGADGGSAQGELGAASFGTKSLVANDGTAPWRMNVKVAFRFGASWFVCSGAMRDIRTVQTAGHCVHQGNGGNFADEVLVYPGWDGVGSFIPFNPDAQTHGGARGVSLGSWTGWTVNGNFDFDWGIIALDRAVGALTGWYGWQTGASCPTATYNVGAYPAEGCGVAGVHNGRDQYYWWGTIDSCPGNQLQINTTAGCFTALWGGESGSNIYELVGSSRFTRGIASTSNRTTIGRYVETKSQWVDWVNTTFIPNNARGNTFDLQALDTNVSPSTIKAGTSTTTLNHLGANGTNGTKNDTFVFDVRLSTNDLISTADTLLSTHQYSFNYPAVGSVRVNSSNVTIPENTPPGTYWVGMRYASATDGSSGNNDSSDWDAHQITVTQETNAPNPNPMFFSVNPFPLDPDRIQMRSALASDPSGGIQYYFDYVNSPTGGAGGSDSGWQASRDYVDAGLEDLHQYCYRVRARDTYGNTTSYSQVRCATTTTLKKCRGQLVTIIGTPGNDSITGTAGPDVIHGLNGSDTIDGAGGKDLICGGFGADTIYGGPGGDTIYSDNGNDTVYGQSGWDMIFAGDGNDTVYGGGGNDIILGKTGNDNLFGQGGNDSLNGGQGNDLCNGGAGAGDSATGSCETIVNTP